MSNEILQGILDIVFSKFLVYVAPTIFLLMVVLFSDELIDLIYRTIKRR